MAVGKPCRVMVPTELVPYHAGVLAHRGWASTLRLKGIDQAVSQVPHQVSRLPTVASVSASPGSARW